MDAPPSPTSSIGSGCVLTDHDLMQPGNSDRRTQSAPHTVIEMETSPGRYGLGAKGLMPDDLFDLTMCSERAKRQVSINTLFGVTRLVFHSGQFAVCVANREFDNDETKLEVEIVEREPNSSRIRKLTSFFRHRMMKKIMNRTINGVEYEIEKSSAKECSADLTFDGRSYRCLNFRRQFSIYTSSVCSAYKDLLKHIFDVFPNEAPVFCVDLRGIRTDNFSISRDLLIYDQVLNSPCLSIGILSNEFVEQAHTILEMMTQLKNLQLDIELNDMEFFSPRMKSIDNLTVNYHRNGISHDNLLSLNCKAIKLWNVNVSLKSLNIFIKQWLLSENERLHFLAIPILLLNEDDTRIEDVLEGIVTLEYDELRRAKFYKQYDWNYEVNCAGIHRFRNCQTGRDLFRADGKLATVLLSVDFFYFFVWHDLFPEQPNGYIPFLDSTVV